MKIVNDCSTSSIAELKIRFETLEKTNDLNGVNLFLLSYVITLMAFLCSQWAPYVQINYFMFDWSIYKLFVLNRGWKRDWLQMMIFVYVRTTCSVVELKTRFETWIASNEVNGVYWFHYYYLITDLALVVKLICAHNGHQISKSNILYVIGRSTDYLYYVRFGNVIRICLFDKQRNRIKNAFWDLNNQKWRKWCEFVLRFLFNNTSGLFVLTMGTICSNQLFYVWLVHLQTICAK
jgi:hypothetical protein